MSELGILNIERRKTVNTRASRKLRKNGYIPASVSCRGKESISVAVKADELRKSLNSHGRNALFRFSLDNDNSTIGMVKEIQLSPVKGEMLHVDLQQVSLNEEIKADLSIRFKGLEALEFKKLMALPQMDEVRVKGLPQDIPDEIVIDVSNIEGVENIALADVDLPKGIVPEISLDQCVVSIVEIKRQEVSDDETEEETVAVATEEAVTAEE
ncbi:MAG TPA: 50S ribosomal protein L25 [Clostridiales bacterium]|nr:50S ribosomal protein L25 [Clostridiales bacterium]